MKIIILRHNSSDFFERAQKLENTHPDGQWRYFNFKNQNEICALYENSAEGVSLHPEFFTYFLGQFKPGIEESMFIHQESSFEDFCEKLNNLVSSGAQIFDLSVTSLWIWSNQGYNETLKVPKKLKTYLSFEG